VHKALSPAIATFEKAQALSTAVGPGERRICSTCAFDRHHGCCSVVETSLDQVTHIA